MSYGDTEELRIPHPYGLPGKIKYVWFLCNGLEILSDFEHAANGSLQIAARHYGSHKVIMDVMDAENMIRKSVNIFQIR